MRNPKSSRLKNLNERHIEELLRQHSILEAEAEAVRENDRVLVKGLFGNFYNKRLGVGIGFQRAFGSILSGDYFELFKIPGNSYLFVFADISGHGLPAYTSLIRLRSSIALTIHDYNERFGDNPCNYDSFVRDIAEKFTVVMESANSHDFASVIFTIIKNYEDKYVLTFYNRGMFFPFVVRKYENNIVDLYDLNKSEKGWIPWKGHLLSPDIHQINEEKYFHFPKCEFVLYEGDCILFFSDGITEALSSVDKTEYGSDRLKSRLLAGMHLPPQGIINIIFEDLYEFMGKPDNQLDDMTAVLIDFPRVRF